MRKWPLYILHGLAIQYCCFELRRSYSLRFLLQVMCTHVVHRWCSVFIGSPSKVDIMLIDTYLCRDAKREEEKKWGRASDSFFPSFYHRRVRTVFVIFIRCGWYFSPSSFRADEENIVKKNERAKRMNQSIAIRFIGRDSPLCVSIYTHTHTSTHYHRRWRIVLHGWACISTLIKFTMH